MEKYPAPITVLHSVLRKLIWKCSLLKGKVVGIIQKNWRDYVVTFPSREESQSQGRNAQKILVTPWDYRIPKIRISTQQAEALQVIWKYFSILYLYGGCHMFWWCFPRQKDR